MNAIATSNEKQTRCFPNRAKPTRLGNGALLDKYELAPKLGESVKTIDTWTKNGVIPFIPCGPHTRRYQLDDVLRALQRRQVTAVRSQSRPQVAMRELNVERS
jgi:hypothetical protein